MHNQNFISPPMVMTRIQEQLAILLKHLLVLETKQELPVLKQSGFEVVATFLILPVI